MCIVVGVGKYLFSTRKLLFFLLPMTISRTSFALTAVVAWWLFVWSASVFAFWSQERSVHREEVKVAVQAQEYTFLSSDFQEKISEEKFASLIEKYQQRQAKKAELKSLVADNDFDAFHIFVSTTRAEKQAKKLERLQDRLLAATTDEQKERIQKRIDAYTQRLASWTTKSLEAMREKFDTLVSYYDEHGALPERSKRSKKRWWFSERK